VKGFKSIRHPARIDLRPLTLLAGANSSGKSSILQPLLLLKQSMELHYDPDPLLMDGPHVTFTSLDQFLPRGQGQVKPANKLEVVFGPPSRPFRRRKRELTKIDVRLTFTRSSPKSERLRVKTSIRRSGTSKWIEVSEGSERALRSFMEIPDAERVEILFQRGSVGTDMLLWPPGADQWSPLPISQPLDWLRTIFHLPGYRGHRERRYPITRVTIDGVGGVAVVGPMHTYAASLLLEWQRLAKDTQAPADLREQATENLRRVADGLRRLELTWKVLSEAVDAAHLELRAGRLPKAQQGGARDLVAVADAGFGLSQVLPVLVGLAAAVPGQMVLVEQPELHLHPRAQLALGGVLAAAAGRGVIVVVETHSQLILRAIQTVVATGKLTPDQVALHWFTRDETTGWSTVSRADLHQDGTFGDWPVDFPDVFSMADEQFIEAVFNGEGSE